jgi:hypothetical protein
VRRSGLPWRPRRRAGFDLDGFGLLAGLGALLLLPLECLAAALVGAGARATGRPWTIEASTAGPPPRRLRWRVRGRTASAEKLDDVARRIEAGEDLSGDADERQVGP